MKPSSRTFHWTLFALAVLLAVSACKLAGPGVTIQIGASATPVPSDTPVPSPTSLPPTATSAPSATPTLAPIPTQPPAPTQASVPAQPTAGLENKPGITNLTIVNGLGVPIKVTLSGPTRRSFTISGLGKMEIELEAGTYNFNITMTGYLPLTGSRTFEVGPFEWTIGK